MSDSTSTFHTHSVPTQLGETESRVSIIKTSDGADQFVRVFESRKPVRIMLVYLHGIEGHSGWFSSTANYLADQGVTTWAVDRRGSGLSTQPRGDMPNFNRLLQDAREVLTLAGQSAGNAPLFLMANCWGAKIAAMIARRREPIAGKLSGLILSSPAVSVKVDVPLATKLEIALHYVLNAPKAIPLPLQPENFTDNPAYLEFIRNDRLRLTEATARFLVQGFFLTWLSAAASTEIELPMLVVQSGIDDIVNIDGVSKWFERSPSTDKTLKIFPGVHHSLDFHREPGEYLHVLREWLLKRAPAGCCGERAQ